MSEEKYTLKEAEQILRIKKLEESKKIRECVMRLQQHFPSGDLPYMNAIQMMYSIYDNRKAIFEILKEYQ